MSRSGFTWDGGLGGLRFAWVQGVDFEFRLLGSLGFRI